MQKPILHVESLEHGVTGTEVQSAKEDRVEVESLLAEPCASGKLNQEWSLERPSIVLPTAATNSPRWHREMSNIAKVGSQP